MKQLVARIWEQQLSSSEQLVPLAGALFRERRVALNVFGSPLTGLSAIEILKVHRYARHVLGFELSAQATVELVQRINDSTVTNADVDLGRLLSSYTFGESQGELERLLENTSPISRPRDVILYGFGRIGRLVARILVEQFSANSGLQLRAIVVRRGSSTDLAKRASLLRRDSVHGKFAGVIKVDEGNESLTINGSAVKIIYANDPSEIDYTSFGISNAH